MKKCIVCDSELNTQLSVARYCADCRPHVSEIQRSVKALIDEAQLPDVRQFNCVDCGNPAKIYEHRYYALPLEVDPVCVSCNLKRGVALDIIDMVRERRGLKVEEKPLNQWSQKEVIKLPEYMADAERKMIVAALEKTHYNAAAAARELGIKYRKIRYLIEKLGITKRRNAYAS